MISEMDKRAAGSQSSIEETSFRKDIGKKSKPPSLFYACASQNISVLFSINKA